MLEEEISHSSMDPKNKVLVVTHSRIMKGLTQLQEENKDKTLEGWMGQDFRNCEIWPYHIP